MKYPKIYLAIDNCFAYKRWTRPKDWAKIIKELGVNYIEASADTELDPFYMEERYLSDWIEDVKEAEKEYDVKVANIYSGHGSYSTLGLTHTDVRVRRKMINQWFKVLIDTASTLNAGFGFFAHAFPDFVLQDNDLYNEYLNILYDGLSELSEYGKKAGCKKIGIEQMYAPHHVPWRIEGAKKLLEVVKNRSGDFYITVDVGHNHTMFIKPNKQKIKKHMDEYQNIGKTSGLHLGTDKAYNLFYDGADIDLIINQIDNCPHMFSKKEDGSCYAWLKEFGAYSPIIHLQQTDGKSSSHLHFTDANNKNGIIKGADVLKAIKISYDKKTDSAMPEKCDELYLTIEAFTNTASINKDTLSDYKVSVDYWRQFIPEDGISLDKLI